MKKIEDILSTNKVFIIDEMACMAHAQVLKKYHRPVENYSWSDKPKHIQLFFKLVFISICHQFNWDYLQEILAKELLGIPESDLINKIEKTTARDISKWLSEYPKQERVRAKERASILRDIGKVIKVNFRNDLSFFYEVCKNTPIKNKEFQNLLDLFLGYRTDPLRKKTNVLTHDLYKECILNFQDPEEINPAVDYHIMRVYLRTGRVIPTDTAVISYLKGKINPRGALVKSLREAVSEAEKLMSLYSGLSIPDINYIEWQIGRGICHNKKPLCLYTEEPLILPEDILAISDSTCPFIDTCSAFCHDRNMITLVEPNYISTNY